MNKETRKWFKIAMILIFAWAFINLSLSLMLFDLVLFVIYKCIGKAEK